MRKYAILNVSRARHAWERPVHIINPATRKTFCQIEKSKAYAMTGRLLSKFDVLPPNNPMCKNCTSLNTRTTL